ncbi:hypothetical protein KIN20_029818 [Parelaphostrongylus tenuis]|uniref:Uncharacterized protein n=1 Tax=Parelaphostrongylus tenuis TaxID=148309 RepID=A0AAD5R3A7_PARTN|nr:hypothetical protein KIN20_029818 [Parelaphostrongylus tenuis]
MVQIALHPAIAFSDPNVTPLKDRRSESFNELKKHISTSTAETSRRYRGTMAVNQEHKND